MATIRPGVFVEVLDPSHRLYRHIGTVAYLVGDNIYVRFSHMRWFSTKVFFAEQLRLAVPPHDARQPPTGEVVRAKPATWIQSDSGVIEGSQCTSNLNSDPFD